MSAGLLASVILLQMPGMHRRISVMLSGAEYLGTEGVIFQEGQNDCGPAALAMVLEGFGHRIGREEILNQIVMTKKGTTMDELRRFAFARGLVFEGWKLEINDLAGRQFPMLFFIKQNHFVAADSIVQGMVYFRDPAIGKLKMPAVRFKKMWDGYALIMKE